MQNSVFHNCARARAGVITLTLAVLFAFSAWTFEIPSLSQPRVDALRDHVRYLASEELTGRGVDTPGIKLARDYIAREFAQYGLRPGGDSGSYLQGFDVATGVTVKQPTRIALGEQPPLRLNEDWSPLGLSGSGKTEAEIVFAGYGITAKEYGYDDYAGIDAKGKIVLVLRYEPPPKDEKSPFQKAPRYSNHATLRAKANNASDHGAAGMILVDLNHSGDEQKELLSTRNSLWRSGNNLIAAQVKRGVIEKWLDAHGLSLKPLKERIDREERPASQVLPAARVTLQVSLEEIRQRAENVVGVLPGSDPTLKDQTIVIGAHYDHVGFGHYGTRDSRAEGQIHHGADDNASGTAVLLQLAERLSRSQPKPARTVVFAAFSAEELGLFGSRHYVNYPPLSLSSTKAMLNLDMVGRLRDNRLTVFGTRSARELSAIVLEEAHKLGLQVSESDSVGRSDHMSFYNRKVPALHFFTGSHPDYHRPSDTWEKLSIEGMVKVTELVGGIVQKVANAKEPLNFVSLPSRPPGGGNTEGQGYGAYLGSIPDFGANGNGVRLAGVSEGSPAAFAGLQEGDVIVKLAEMKIQDLEDLMAALRSKKPGDSVEITILRNSQPLTLSATLRPRS
ncbi:MAG TPA: M20/M25/M40 family metallo-hydrolase [Candidatus Binatia bacterium]|nr:M20/M25/M40 family metallo-hydrolase [Candidatus Binatia bacterium]